MKEFRTDMVMEGGAIEVNGSGTCLATEQCLLNSNRNPSLGQAEIEQIHKDLLGLNQLIWLGEGSAGDDTDGHMDEIARFVSSNIICAASEEDSTDENFKSLRDNWNRLSKIGNLFRLIALPMPDKIEMNGKRYPASYANFYIGNKTVLVPIFRQKTDSKALGILKELFPDRNVVGIDAIPLVYGQGALHCITQQEPAKS
jgi:agmatine deiminase